MNENSIWLSWVSAFLNLMKYFYVGSSPSKYSVIVICKISLNSCLKGLDQLFTDRASRSSREKDLKNIFSTTSPAYLTWPWENDLDQRVDGSEFDFGQNLFLFASFLIFFFLLVQFSFWLLQFFCFFIWLKIFRFIKFSSLLPYVARPPEVL